MVYLLLLVFHIFFVAFFVNIGARYVSIIPIGFICFFVFNNTLELWDRNEIYSFVEHDMYYVSWSVVLLALYLLLITMGMNLIYVGLVLIILNVLLYIGSLLFAYKDGIITFHLGRYVVWFMYIAHIGISYGPIVAWKVFCLLCVFHFAVYGFIQYIVGSFVGIPKLHGYMTFLYAQALVLITLGAVQSSNILINLLAGQLYLMGNYMLIYSVLRYYHYYEHHHKADLRYILAGNKLLDAPQILQSVYLDRIYHFFEHLTPAIKYGFGGLNIVIVALIIIVFTRQYQTVSLFSVILYRCSLALFFANYSLLKQIRYQSQLERMAVFMVLNVGALLGIGAMFDDMVMQVIVAITWNLLSSVAIFRIRQDYSDMLMPRDYWYRLRANTLSVGFIVRWIVILPINPSVRFSLCLFYCCLYTFITLQVYKFLIHKEKSSQNINSLIT